MGSLGKHWISKIRGRTWEGPSRRGENNPNWKGGLSQFKYGATFYKIRKLLNELYDSCALCGKRGIKLSAHHIDYNKNNNRITNFVLLCKRCHGRTNRNRNLWKDYFYLLFYFGKIPYKNGISYIEGEIVKV